MNNISKIIVILIVPVVLSGKPAKGQDYTGNIFAGMHSSVVYEAETMKAERLSGLQTEYSSMVYEAGVDGYDFFRIPALVKTGNLLIAFTEGRKNSLSDHGQIDLVLKISKDQGKTWGKPIRAIHYEGQSCQNPTPAYIPEDNKLLLLFTKRTVATDTETMIREGSAEGYVGAYVTESTDLGQTWSSPREITSNVKKKSWRWYAFGPGGAIILKHNDHKGRIIIPADHSISGGKGNEYLGSHVVYSDDQGSSWEIGAIDSEGYGNINPNELAVIETVFGSLYFNTRSQNFDAGHKYNRAITYSNDGGITFTRKFFPEACLVTPVVHASITRTDDKVVFVAPNDPGARINLSIWMSFDETLTWSSPRLIQEGPSAYSSCLMLDESNLGILFEAGEENPYERIIFKKINTE